MTQIIHKSPKQFIKAIGAEIKLIRKEAGLNQTQVAKAMGLDQSAFSRIEAGKQHITLLQFIVFVTLLKSDQKEIFLRIWRAAIQ